MRSSLSEYLRIKVHSDIQSKSWSRILIKGEHDRDPFFNSLSSIEKKDKPFNWQRPTASHLESETLQLQCFPGIDYVKHYAAIIAIYLSLKGEAHDHIHYNQPTQWECLKPLLQSNLPRMGPVDIVIVGYVDGLKRWTQGPWDFDDDDDLFAWKTMRTRQGYQVAFLGCRICFWGDIGGNLVRALKTMCRAKCLIYVGKLGSLCGEDVPNHKLATGDRSFVDGQVVKWSNPLENSLKHAPSVIRGEHHSMPSVLDETKEWLDSVKDRYDFVDSEIGPMAKASVEEGMQFGYLHINSNNLARKYEHDLSNERLVDVLEGRKKLLVEIQDVLGHFFDHWTPKG